MTIVDELNAKVARDRASDDEVARLMGYTGEEMDADMTRLDHADVTALDPIPFQTFVHGAGILLDRDAFHAFAVAEAGEKPKMFFTEWIKLWNRYCDIEQARFDARDLQDTQATALDRACSRFDDGDDERHDPHLDALI
jgi:hypothetical protein